MADVIQASENIFKRYVDMGDGSYAEIIVVVNEDGSPVGGGGESVNTGLTNEELRASSVLVALDSAALTALESIQIGSLPAVTLDSTTLTALESITVQSSPGLTDSQLRANPVPVSGSFTTDSNAARRGTLTDRSGTITVGGTAQQLMAVNANRKYVLIINPSNASEALYINFTTTAVITGPPSIRLDAGDSFVMEGEFVTTELISVNAATTGHAFVAKEG